MRRRAILALLLCLYVLGGMPAPMGGAQRAGTFRGSPEDPAINYSTGPLNNPVVEVNRKLRDGAIRFTFEGRSGFPPSLKWVRETSYPRRTWTPEETMSVPNAEPTQWRRFTERLVRTGFPRQDGGYEYNRRCRRRLG